jgi:hypothetical protein
MMLVLVVSIIMAGIVLRARYNAVARRDHPETEVLRRDLQRIQARLAVVERLAIEKDHSLAQEIERLRDGT